MIQQQEEGGEKYLEVETGPGEDPRELIKDFRKAFRRGLPIRAPAEVAREFGFPERAGRRGQHGRRHRGGSRPLRVVDMKRPWSKDDYQREFADEIIRQIERGVAPWQKPWKPGERGSPENFSHRENLIPGATTSTWPFAG